MDDKPIAATKTVTTRDGRTLAYLEVGDPHGPLVIHNHGGPSSRLEARLFANSASKHALRFICVDRPGIGQSSPQKGRSYAGRADDMTTIADALGRREFGVTGWSEGGPGAVWHPVEGAGHFVALGSVDEILAIAAAELGSIPWLVRARTKPPQWDLGQHARQATLAPYRNVAGSSNASSDAGTGRLNRFPCAN